MTLVLPYSKNYESKIEKAPLGKNFRECYDVKRLKPSNEYLKLYNKMKLELEDQGVPFIY